MQKHFLPILAIIGLILFPAALGAEEIETTPASKLSLFPVLARGAGPDSSPVLIPVINNHPLGGAHPNLTRVIIGIHDTSRNAQGLVTILSTIAGAADSKILILAPQFLDQYDIERFYPDMPDALRKTLAFWPADAWIDGGETKAEPPAKPISSFTVIDLLLMYLGEKTNFPSLKDIYIAGHGSGADFVQRYAVMGAATNLLEKEGIAVHFVVANASSYLYVTAARPKTDSMGFATPKTASCLMYNYYKYGLEYLNNYGRQIGANAMKTDYGDRRVTYLLGENIGPADPSPDENCAARLEGPNRYARGVNYSTYVYQLYGDAVTQKQKTYIIPKTAYNPIAMFGSACGVSVLFGDGSCPEAISPGVEIQK